MQRISTLDDIAAALEALCIADPRLAAVRAVSGEVPLRRSEPGFVSLASIIVSQQVSRASADAIFARLVALADPLAPETLLAADDTLFREAGLSRPKQRALLSASEAVQGGLDLAGLCALDAEQAIAHMTAVFRHRSLDRRGLSAVGRGPPRRLPGARRGAPDRGRSRTRPGPPSG